MTKIEVKNVGSEQFEVTVTESGGSSSHVVRVTEDDRARLGGEADSERLLEESFRFLLEREPKEAILSRFDLPVIGRYFPEYPQEIKKRLG